MTDIYPLMSWQWRALDRWWTSIRSPKNNRSSKKSRNTYRATAMAIALSLSFLAAMLTVQPASAATHTKRKLTNVGICVMPYYIFSYVLNAELDTSNNVGEVTVTVTMQKTSSSIDYASADVTLYSASDALGPSSQIIGNQIIKIVGAIQGSTWISEWASAILGLLDMGGGNKYTVAFADDLNTPVSATTTLTMDATSYLYAGVEMYSGSGNNDDLYYRIGVFMTLDSYTLHVGGGQSLIIMVPLPTNNTYYYFTADPSTCYFTSGTSVEDTDMPSDSGGTTSR